MDNTKVGSIIEFDNHKTYTVFHVMVEDDNQYLYLATINEPLEIVFAKMPIGSLDPNDLITVTEQSEKEKLFQKLKELV